MDFSPLLLQAANELWYLPLILILLLVIKSSWFKGKAGEAIVNLATKRALNKKQYRLIKNVTLPTADSTTQIDHIIVSPYGVFVVETKNMKGWIFGNAKQKMWTQKIYKHSSTFQNPLHQNYKHIKTLEALLGLSSTQLYSIVAFVGDCKLKTTMPENVTNGLGFIRYVKSKRDRVLTDNEMNDIVSTIESVRLTPSMRTDREHVRRLKKVVRE